MSDFDALVEKAARAMHVLLDLNDRWDQMVGSDRESYREMVRPSLEAVGLPALLERVEAAEGALDEVRELWKAAVEDRDDAIALMSGLLLQTPSIGDDKDGFIAGYVMPTGPVHRIASYLTQHGQSFSQARHYAEMKSEHEEVVADRDALAAKVARVEALMTRWIKSLGHDQHADELRAALDAS